MLKPKLIDLIIPVYNTVGYLDKLLASLEKQTLSTDKWNVIFIDDGSTDGSFEKLEGWTLKRENAIVVAQKNAGPGKAREKAMQFVASEWIIFADSDGYLSKGYLAAFARHAKPQYDFVFSDNFFFFYENKKYNKLNMPFRRFGRTFYNIWFDLHNNPDAGDPRSKMFRASIVKDIDWTKHKRGEDWIWLAKALAKIRKNAYKRVVLNNMYFDHYGRPNSTADLVRRNPDYLKDQAESHRIAAELLRKTDHKLTEALISKVERVAEKSENKMKQMGIEK